MIDKMVEKNTSILNRLSERRSEMVAFSRLMNNPKLQADGLIEKILISPDVVEGREVIVVQDTTEFNYQDHIHYLNLQDGELGPTGNNMDMGFFLHPGLVIDQSTKVGLGFSYIKIWNRDIHKMSKEEREYKKQPIESKESYRWIECAEKSKEPLRTAKHITIIADRESNIYEEFVRVPDYKTDLIIRSKENRIIHGESLKLYEKLGQSEVLGKVKVKLKKDSRKEREKREATLEIRICKVKIIRPKTHKNKTLPEYVELYAISATEVNVPASQDKICWRLLTTYNVEGLAGALEVINLYCVRWQIKILFSTIKTSGIDIESSQLEKGKALKALCVFGLYVSLKINQLKQAREDQTGLSASIIFSKEEIIVLCAVCKKYEGKTEKQKNKYIEGTLVLGSMDNRTYRWLERICK